MSVFSFVHQIFGSTVGNNVHRNFCHLKQEAYPTDEKPKGMSAFIQENVLDLDLLQKINGYDEVGGSNVEHSNVEFGWP